MRAATLSLWGIALCAVALHALPVEDLSVEEVNEGVSSRGETKRLDDGLKAALAYALRKDNKASSRWATGLVSGAHAAGDDLGESGEIVSDSDSQQVRMVESEVQEKAAAASMEIQSKAARMHAARTQKAPDKFPADDDLGEALEQRANEMHQKASAAESVADNLKEQTDLGSSDEVSTKASPNSAVTLGEQAHEMHQKASAALTAADDMKPDSNRLETSMELGSSNGILDIPAGGFPDDSTHDGKAPYAGSYNPSSDLHREIPEGGYPNDAGNSYASSAFSYVSSAAREMSDLGSSYDNLDAPVTSSDEVEKNTMSRDPPEMVSSTFGQLPFAVDGKKSTSTTSFDHAGFEEMGELSGASDTTSESTSVSTTSDSSSGEPVSVSGSESSSGSASSLSFESSSTSSSASDTTSESTSASTSSDSSSGESVSVSGSESSSVSGSESSSGSASSLSFESLSASSSASGTISEAQSSLSFDSLSVEGSESAVVPTNSIVDSSSGSGTSTILSSSDSSSGSDSSSSPLTLESSSTTPASSSEKGRSVADLRALVEEQAETIKKLKSMMKSRASEDEKAEFEKEQTEKDAAALPLRIKRILANQDVVAGKPAKILALKKLLSTTVNKAVRKAIENKIKKLESSADGGKPKASTLHAQIQNLLTTGSIHNVTKGAKAAAVKASLEQKSAEHAQQILKQLQAEVLDAEKLHSEKDRKFVKAKKSFQLSTAKTAAAAKKEVADAQKLIETDSVKEDVAEEVDKKASQALKKASQAANQASDKYKLIRDAVQRAKESLQKKKQGVAAVMEKYSADDAMVKELKAKATAAKKQVEDLKDDLKKQRAVAIKDDKSEEKGVKKSDSSERDEKTAENGVKAAKERDEKKTQAAKQNIDEVATELATNAKGADTLLAETADDIDGISTNNNIDNVSGTAAEANVNDWYARRIAKRQQRKKDAAYEQRSDEEVNEIASAAVSQTKLNTAGRKLRSKIIIEAMQDTQSDMAKTEPGLVQDGGQT